METVILRNSDFRDGSYVLSKDNVCLKLGENILFNPNPDHDWMPRDEQFKSNGGKYDDAAFQLGFMGAIVLDGCKNFKIDFNGFEGAQHPEHQLQQRFFAFVVVGSSPFIKGAGPADFVGDGSFNKAGPGRITGGILGRSSHHGVLGNDANNIEIDHMHFRDIEIEEVHFNNVDGLHIHDCTVLMGARNVPVLGIYSAARFIRSHVQQVIDDESLEQDVRNEAQNKLDALQDRMDTVLADVRQTGSTSDELFRNVKGLPDGTGYCFSVTGRGPAVNDLAGDAAGRSISQGCPFKRDVAPPLEESWSANVKIHDVVILSRKVSVVEIPAISEPYDEESKAKRDSPRAYAQAIQTDPVGAVFHVQKCLDKDTGKYVPNEVSECQVLVAKHHGKGSLSDGIISWASTGSEKDLDEVIAEENLTWHCNGDSMFHVNKGLFGIRLDNVDGCEIYNLEIQGLQNLSPIGNETLDGNYELSHFAQIQKGYQGCALRGICISACKNVTGRSIKIKDCVSNNGMCCGIDIRSGSSGVSFTSVEFEIENKTSRNEEGLNNVNPEPSVVAFQVDDSCIDCSVNSVDSDPMFNLNFKIEFEFYPAVFIGVTILAYLIMSNM